MTLVAARARAHVCDARIAALVGSLRLNSRVRECVQGGCLSPIGMLPIVRVEAALSEQRQKGPSPPNVRPPRIHCVPPVAS